MTSDQIRSRFLEFFKKRGHAIIPSASLVPENDPTVLFNTAGMQPLVPYLLGEKHPMGTRLADVQKCVRTGDIDDIGDNRHLTFFEMLGNWSLGDYFKKESIGWSMEFLTSSEEGLGLDPKRLYVTTFKGEDGIPRDEEAIHIWKKEFKKKGMEVEVSEHEEMGENVRIVPLGVNDNFWIAGTTGPCGGDTEIFYDTNPEAGELSGKFGDLVDSFRLIEIWNNVFMEFNKTSDGRYEKLAKPNVDTGMGLERTTAVINDKTTVFDTDIFEPILSKIESLAKNVVDEKPKRIIADHVRAAAFMIADGVRPSNTDQGYILRRLLRRAIIWADQIEMEKGGLIQIVDTVILKFKGPYPELFIKQNSIRSEIQKEEEKFRSTLETGMKEFKKVADRDISGTEAFKLFSTFGFPIELTKEMASLNKIAVDTIEFEAEFKKHQDLSRAGAEKKFKGGLGDTSDISIRYHTATHLLNAALRKVLGEHVSQKGSNITPERLRFDFSHTEKMTDEQKKQVEDLVNAWITEALPVTNDQMPKTEAEKIALHVFSDKYGDVVSVYSIGAEGNYISREFCGGPHISNTKELGHFKIQKEEAVSAGVRRIKAVLV